MASKGPLGGSDKKTPVGPQFNDPNFRISGMTVWCSDGVNSLQLHYVDKNDNTPFDGNQVGGGGGAKVEIRFGAGENLTAIDIRAGHWIDALTFYTSTGAQYTFGGTGGAPVGTLGVDNPSNQSIFDLAVGFGAFLKNLTIFYQ